ADPRADAAPQASSAGLPFRAVYYDRQGTPIPLMEWARLFEDDDYKMLARTDLDDAITVSTIWLGIDHGSLGRVPLIFETMVFGPTWCDLDCWRYATEAQALEGHTAAVRETLQKLAEHLSS